MHLQGRVHNVQHSVAAGCGTDSVPLAACTVQGNMAMACGVEDGPAGAGIMRASNCRVKSYLALRSLKQQPSPNGKESTAGNVVVAQLPCAYRAFLGHGSPQVFWSDFRQFDDGKLGMEMQNHFTASLAEKVIT